MLNLKNITPKILLWFCLLASVISLAAAFVAEYGFGLKPCELCLLQRVPYAVVIVLASVAIIRTKFEKITIIAIICTFFIGGGIATYHAGVEQGIFPGPSACASTVGGNNQSIEELLKRIENAPIVACDIAAWSFHGITMAAMNAVWSFLLALFVGYARFR